MAHVMQCDQCENIDKFNKLKHIEVKLTDSDSDTRYNTDTISGDFCSLECAKQYIHERLAKIWYNWQ